MKSRNNPPYAPNLIESMRSIGYSFNTALADIVDNSIAAEAQNIDIIIVENDNDSYIEILDNGFGMNEQQLFEAMKYGTYNPNDVRSKNDMGRFGLGLKSASLSQCRKLTVLSKSQNSKKIFGFSWDLDFIIETGEWSIQELEESDIQLVHGFERLNNLSGGTLVVWENLDRIIESSLNINDSFKDLMEGVIDHFSLIYHRLLNRKFVLTINGIKIMPRDPFLENNKSTQLKREQKFYIDGQQIVVKPYILPHVNKMTNDDIIKVGGKESLRSEQGFYIYRNKRLIIWGTWFRLGNKQELTKLARVRVDIPNSLDYIWNIDVKKSKASLPNKIKYDLYNAVVNSCETSEYIHEYKGRKALDNSVIRAWNVIEKRKGEGLGLEINLDNPLIESFMDSLSREQKRVFYSIVEDVENNIPLDYIYSKIARGENTNSTYISEEKEGKIKRIIKKIKEYEQLGMDINEILDIFEMREDVANDPFILSSIKEMRN